MRPVVAVLVVLALAGCDSGSGGAGADRTGDLRAAMQRTLDARTARIASTTRAETPGGGPFVYHTRGAVSLAGRHGRLDEDAIDTIYDGNVQYGHLGSPLPENRWLRHPLGPRTETTLGHLQLLLYLATGATKVDGKGRLLTARIDPSRIDAPAALARLIRKDYGTKPFDATFALDGQGRLTRVEARIERDGVTTYRLDLGDFGVATDSKLPAGSVVQR